MQATFSRIMFKHLRVFLANRSIYFDDIPRVLPYSNGLYCFRRPISGILSTDTEYAFQRFRRLGPEARSWDFRTWDTSYTKGKAIVLLQSPRILYIRNSGLHSPLRHLQRPLLRLITSYKSRGVNKHTPIHPTHTIKCLISNSPPFLR